MQSEAEIHIPTIPDADESASESEDGDEKVRTMQQDQGQDESNDKS
jgi:hypothetical protein